MRLSKKIFAALLATLMVISVMPITVFASEATDLNDQISAFEQQMKDGNVYTNVASAYEAYVDANEAYDAYTYGKSTSVDLVAAKNALQTARNNMSVWTKPTANAVTSYETNELDGSTDRAVLNSVNLLASNRNGTTGDSQAYDNTVEYWRIRVYYPENVLLYDGVTQPMFPVVFSNNLTAKNKSRYTHTVYPASSLGEKASTGNDSTEFELYNGRNAGHESCWVGKDGRTNYSWTFSQTEKVGAESTNKDSHYSSNHSLANWAWTSNSTDPSFYVNALRYKGGNPGAAIKDVQIIWAHRSSGTQDVGPGNTDITIDDYGSGAASTHTYIYNYAGIKEKVEAVQKNRDISAYKEGGFATALAYSDTLTQSWSSMMDDISTANTAYSNISTAATADSYDSIRTAITNYASVSNTDNKYTASSFSAFSTAYNNAVNHMAALPTSGYNATTASGLASELNTAYGNLVEKVAITFVDINGTSTTGKYDPGTSAATLEADAPKLPDADYDDNNHYTYGWDKAFADVSTATTYTQVKASTTPHSFTYTHDENSAPSTHTGTCEVGGQTHSTAPEACTFVDVHTDATDALNGYTDKKCSVCEYVDEDQRVYDLQDFQAYDDAMDDYDAVKGADNYTAKYTAASRKAYEDAVAAASIDKTNATLSPKAIANAAKEITDAKGNLGIASYTITYSDGEGNSSTETYEYGTPASVVEANAPAVHEMTNDATNHYTYAWGDFADVTGAATYTQTKTTTAHTYADAHTVATDDRNGYTDQKCSVCEYVDETQRVYDLQDFTEYDTAIGNYNTVIGAADYETTYTEKSRKAYADAVAAASIDKNNATLSPKAIKEAADAINAAFDLLAEHEAENTYNLTLDDGIDVNFNIDTAFYQAQGGTIKYSYLTTTEDMSADRTEETVNVDDIQNASGKSPITIEAAPAQIAEPYVIEVYNNNNVLIDTLTTSIQDYCNTIIKGNYDAKEQAVAKALLNYGALANDYFGYSAISEAANPNTPYVVEHTSDYLDDVDTDEIKTKARAQVPTGVTLGYVPGNDESGKPIYVTNVAYVALLDPEFRFYVSQENEVWAALTPVSITDLDGNKIEGVTAKMIKTNAGNCVRVTGIKAGEFGKPFILNIGGGKLTYNGYAYLYSALTSNSVTNESLKNLAKGVYRYAAACEAKANA